MTLSKSRIAGLAGILLTVAAGSAAAGNYGMYPPGMGMGYGRTWGPTATVAV